MFCQVTLVYKSRFACDLGNRPALREQLSRTVDAHLIQVCMRRQADLLFENPNQVKSAEPGQPRNLSERNVLGKVSLNEIQSKFDGSMLISSDSHRRTDDRMSRHQLRR